MFIWHNNLLPFKGFSAMNIGGVILAVRKEVVMTDVIENHERIHSRQIFELLIVFFYLWYVVEWFVKLFKYRKNSYYNISFEREAYKNERDLDYLKERRLFSWFKYL